MNKRWQRYKLEKNSSCDTGYACLFAFSRVLDIHSCRQKATVARLTRDFYSSRICAGKKAGCNKRWQRYKLEKNSSCDTGCACLFAFSRVLDIHSCRQKATVARLTRDFFSSRICAGKKPVGTKGGRKNGRAIEKGRIGSLCAGCSE